MALTNIERKILVKARSLIKRERYTYVCYAIQAVSFLDVSDRELKDAKDRLCKYISDALGDAGTLGGWLRVKCNRGVPADPDLLRAVRVAWITWMLDEPLVIGPNMRRAIYFYQRPHLKAHCFELEEGLPDCV